MKAAAYCTKILFLLMIAMCLNSCIGPVPVDVVMIDDEVFFMLEEEHEINSLRVMASVDRKKMGKGEVINPMWFLAHDVTTEVDKRSYPRLKQIKYGQEFKAFPVVEGPFTLQRNVEYSIEINMGNKFAREIFFITSDHKVIMPQPHFLRQKGRHYVVSVDQDGNKILMPETVSK
jgi:hypothetical protein